MKPEPGIALVCDCDGVLIDSEAVASRILLEELSRRWPGVAVAKTVMPLLGLRIERVLYGAAEQLGQTLTDTDVADIRGVIEHGMINAPVIPGVVAALQKIDLPKACASNSYTAEVTVALERHGMTDLFGKHVYCADQVPQPKPAPDVYLAAARGLGLPPERCIVVEDSTTGVRSAAAAGTLVLGFTGGAHSGPHRDEALQAAGAAICFGTMDLLPQLVAECVERIGRSAVEHTVRDPV